MSVSSILKETGCIYSQFCTVTACLIISLPIYKTLLPIYKTLLPLYNTV